MFIYFLSTFELVHSPTLEVCQKHPLSTPWLFSSGSAGSKNQYSNAKAYNPFALAFNKAGIRGPFICGYLSWHNEDEHSYCEQGNPKWPINFFLLTRSI